MDYINIEEAVITILEAHKKGTISTDLAMLLIMSHIVKPGSNAADRLQIKMADQLAELLSKSS